MALQNKSGVDFLSEICSTIFTDEKTSRVVIIFLVILILYFLKNGIKAYRKIHDYIEEQKCAGGSITKIVNTSEIPPKIEEPIQTIQPTQTERTIQTIQAENSEEKQ